MSQVKTSSVPAVLANLAMPVQAAMRLLEKHSLDDLNKIEDLAKRLGLRVEYVDSLPCSGFAHTDDDGAPFIAVNSRTDPTHQQVTIVEEIGHHVLGHLRQPWRAKEECDQEAKRFACALLMRSGAMVSITDYGSNNPDVAEMFYIVFMIVGLPGVIADAIVGAIALAMTIAEAYYKVAMETPVRVAGPLWALGEIEASSQKNIALLFSAGCGGGRGAPFLSPVGTE